MFSIFAPAVGKRRGLISTLNACTRMSTFRAKSERHASCSYARAARAIGRCLTVLQTAPC